MHRRQDDEATMSVSARRSVLGWMAPDMSFQPVSGRVDRKRAGQSKASRLSCVMSSGISRVERINKKDLFGTRQEAGSTRARVGATRGLGGAIGGKEDDEMGACDTGSSGFSRRCDGCGVFPACCRGRGWGKEAARSKDGRRCSRL